MRVNEIELRYKRDTLPECKIRSSKDTYQYLLQIWSSETIGLYEEFKVLLLDNANNILAVYDASKGGISSTLLDIRLVLAVALKTAACGIIAAHNHPSGNLVASIADKDLTNKLSSACHFLDIRLLDHLIISEGGYFSFSDEGVL